MFSVELRVASRFPLSVIGAPSVSVLLRSRFTDPGTLPVVAVVAAALVLRLRFVTASEELKLNVLAATSRFVAAIGPRLSTVTGCDWFQPRRTVAAESGWFAMFSVELRSTSSAPLSVIGAPSVSVLLRSRLTAPVTLPVVAVVAWAL